MVVWVDAGLEVRLLRCHFPVITLGLSLSQLSRRVKQARIVHVCGQKEKLEWRAEVIDEASPRRECTTSVYRLASPTNSQGVFRPFEMQHAYGNSQTLILQTFRVQSLPAKDSN